jgi:pimeloyl-ACP methyl ester carboxylesterase
MKQTNSLNDLVEMNINNSDQWVLVRGKNINAPLLIHVQAGPGLPMISEANEMEKHLHLEEKFLVAYWDQRGCGKSFNKHIPTETITLTQMADDIIACTKYLLKKYNKSKAIVVGYSIGATTGLMAAVRDSSIFSVLFAAGTDVDIPYANHYALDFAMDKATAWKNNKLIKKINELKSRPITESIRFQQRAVILSNLGGINADSNYNSLVLGAVKNMLFSKYYGLGGLIKTMKGMEFCQNALIPEMNGLNLFQNVTKLSVPVHFIQGNLDAIAPVEKGKEYYEQLQAPDKSFTLFEKSAHMPQYEEPEKFSKLILSFSGLA